MRADPAISVIVPIYNIADYLVRCLDSLAVQTYNDIEVLMVDDGSTDESPSICREFELKYDNFFYFRKENGGLSDARNYGIRRARGTLVALVDGDDCVSKTFIEALVGAFSEDIDISVCGYYAVNRNQSSPVICAAESMSGTGAMRRMIAKQSQLDVVAWNKMYRRSLFDSIEYPVGRLHEDVFTTYRLLASARKVRFIDLPLYYYFQREGSIMSNMSRKRLDVLNAGIEMKEFCEREGIEARKELEAFNVSTRIVLLTRIARAGAMKDLRTEYKDIAKGISVVSCMINPYVSLRQTIIGVIGKYFSCIFPALLTVYDRASE